MKKINPMIMLLRYSILFSVSEFVRVCMYVYVWTIELLRTLLRMMSYITQNMVKF